jgi:hypothetical protein
MKTLTSKFSILITVIFIYLTVSMFIFFSTSNLKAQYSGNGNHEITLAQAVKFIDNFKNNPTAPSIKGGYFSRNIFDKILAQNGCIGIRYYYAKKDDGTHTIILVGVNNEGRDMENGILGEWSYPCPPLCDSPNQLNK